MLQVAHKVLCIGNAWRSICVLSSTRYSARDPCSIKEAPLLDNKTVMASSEEAKLMKNIDGNVCVSVMPDLTPINGIPENYLMTRMVRIFQPAKNAMQSGTNNIQHWELEFDNRIRWENPLMGWTSSGDPLSNLKMKFRQPCEAVEYCMKNGWRWFLDVPKTEREFKPKAYKDNFSWDKRTRISTK